MCHGGLSIHAMKKKRAAIHLRKLIEHNKSQ